MTALLAATPLAVVLVLMGVLRRSAVVAGGAGLLLAAILAVTVFDPASTSGAAVPAALGGTVLEAVHSTGTILWIILPALALYAFQQEAGAIERIRAALAGLTDDRRLQAILIAWFFGLFIEGAAGFGTPVALAAPLLVGLGYSPVRAVVLALLGHAAGVSFGAVGTPVLAQIEMTGLAPTEIALRAALLHAVLGPTLLLVMVRLAGDGPLSRKDILWSSIAAACFFLPSILLAWTTGPELPSLGGALFGTAAFIAILRRFGGGGSIPNPRGLLPDLAPYLLILALVLLTRLVGPVQEGLSGFAFDWRLYDTFAGAFQPLYHPGTLLLIGLGLGAAITGRTALVPGALATALKRLLPVAIALLIMLTLSRLMVHAGLIAVLADAAARTGTAWPLLSPMVGVLGTFITGSATASNILFTDLQLSAAATLALPAPLMAASQAFGSAIGNVIAPHNIIAGSATVGLVGKEGEILAKTVIPGLAYTALGGVAILLLTLVL